MRTLEIRIKEYGPDHKYTAISYNNLGNTLSSLGETEEAELNYRRSIAIWEKQSARHPDLAEGYHNLALFVGSQGRAKEAADLNRRAVGIYRELGLEGSRYANIMNSLGKGLNDAGEFAEAEGILRESLQRNVATVGENSLQAGANHLTLSRTLVGLGRYSEALEHARMGHTTFQSVLGKDHLFTAAARSYVGHAEWRSGAIDAGRRSLETAIVVQRERLGDGWRASQTLLWLAQLDLHLGEFGKAEPKLRETIELRLIRHPGDSWAIAEVQVVVADCLIRQGRHDEAQELLSVAVGNLTRRVGSEDYRTRTGESLIASIPTGP